MKTALLAAIGAAAVTIASPALAQDEASSFNWPYVGVLGGYDNFGLNTSREDGVLYGGVIGYDINLDGGVFGVEGEYSDSDTKFRTEDLLVTGDSARIKTGRDLYAGVRVGGPITQNVMLYAKGGYTNAQPKSVNDRSKK